MTDGLLGLKFGKRDPYPGKPALRLRSFLSGQLPAHPLAVDHLTALTGWQMLGNDEYGVCGPVTWSDFRRVMSRLAGVEYYPDFAAVVELYRTQNPGFPDQDDGVWLHILLDHLIKNGGPDGVRPLAFAKVDSTNRDEVAAALAIFGCLWTGFGVQRANMEIDWRQGKPFDYHPGSPFVGGHSVLTGGYDSDRVGSDKVFKTWAQVTAFTEEGWRHLVDEAWVVVWPEHLGTAQFLEGIDLGKLKVSYQLLTGRILDIPDPPAPPAIEPDDLLEAPLRAWAEQKPREQWSSKTKAGRAARAAYAWLEQLD